MGNLVTHGFYSLYNIDTKIQRVKSITNIKNTKKSFKNQLTIWRLCNNILQFQDSDSLYLNNIHVTHTTQ